MYACLHKKSGTWEDLECVVRQFAPAFEVVDEDTVVFSIAELRRLLGPPHQIASAIAEAGEEYRVHAQLAIARNPDTCILLAQSVPGVTLVTPGQESHHLASLPLQCLLTHLLLDQSSAAQANAPAQQRVFTVLQRWGVRTCGDLAELPAKGVLERLGPDGAYLQQLALGAVDRPLRLQGEETTFEQKMILEHPLPVLEPLLFLLGSALRELCTKLRSHSLAAQALRLTLQLEEASPYFCELEFPSPLLETKTLLKLLQLHLERHPPGAAITGFQVALQSTPPKRLQKDLFLPATPQPDTLELTLARIRNLVGKENVSTPYPLNTHRFDAFRHRPFCVEEGVPVQPANSKGREEQAVLRLAMRIFRPALQARVQIKQSAPKTVVAQRVQGTVVRSAGPWKTCGEWWANTAWAREEWDVALDDGGLYRIYQESSTQAWFVEGIYD